MFGDVWVSRGPRFHMKNNNRNHEDLGRGTLNTCAKTQGLRTSLNNGVNVQTLLL